MPDPLPAEIMVTELPDGVRFLLPRRPLGKLSWLGVGALAFGVAFTAFALFWLWQVLQAPAKV